MLIVALVLAVIGLAALVTAVVTSNELIAWVCIAASVIGVLLLIVDALRERNRTGDDDDGVDADDVDDETSVLPATETDPVEDYPDEQTDAAEAHTSTIAVDSHDDDATTESKKL